MPQGCDGPTAFARSEWGDMWPEAQLASVCLYVRGSIHLRVPLRWKSAFPTEIPVEEGR